MLFLRNVIDNNRILTSILVISFCLFFGLYHAFAVTVLGVISGILGVITVIQIIRSLIKSLDEQIEIKETEVLWLDQLKKQWKKEYDRREVERKQRELEAEAAQKAYDQAVTDYNSAVTEEKSARRSYNTAVHYADTARRNYIDHVQSCSECRGSSLCPIGHNLHAAWQSWEKAKREAKTAWDKAKANLSAAEAAKKAAGNTLFEANIRLAAATTAANDALNQWRAIGKELKRAAGELAALQEEKRLEDEKLKKAMEDLDSGKQQLNVVEQNNPDEWTEAMEDSYWRQAVEEIRSFY